MQICRSGLLTGADVVSSATTVGEGGQALLDGKRAEWRDRWDAVLADVDAQDIQTAARVMHRLAAIFSGL